jgi:hypothetical protein
MSLPTVTPAIPLTAVQLSNTPITVNSATSSSSSQNLTPTLSTRPAGWHAKSFGFDWNKRADQHKYLVKSGLPEVHAAIMNDDWDLALELICPEDFGLLWFPPASQRPPKNGRTDLDASSWTVELLSQNENIKKIAIMGMAMHYSYITSTGDNCLYGANLLTLCLLKPARPDVMQHVITLAKTQAPHYLNLPDAVGRTPLWVAIENQDLASVQLLLKAGADLQQECEFSEEGEPKSPLSLVAKYTDKEFFCELVRTMIDQEKDFTPYDFDEDPLYIKRWASIHTPEDVLWLADQVKVLSGPLFCCDDISGTSYFLRSVIDRSLDNKLASGNEDLIEWLRTLDVSPGSYREFKSSPLFVAASAAPIQTYGKLVDFLYEKISDSQNNEDEDEDEDDDLRRLRIKINENFLLSRTSEELDQFIKIILPDFHELDDETKYNKKQLLIQQQYIALTKNQHILDFNKYARVVKSVWPFISDKQKNTLFLDAATRSDERMDLVFGMLDCALTISTVEGILQSAVSIRNTRAFEFAADRSFKMGQVLESLKAGNDAGQEMFDLALTAGSLKWVEKLIAAGLNLLDVIISGPYYISQLADLDPQGFPEKIKGLENKINTVVMNTKTEAGKQALMVLVTRLGNKQSS